jgi:heparan-alpha-glucosaminide N-acetyltransferase
LARIRSIDVLRGLDVLLMLFVNEVAGVPGAPRFLLHKGPADDGMTVTDLVFPTFLFIVGLAIPLALSARLRRGASRLAVLRHVVERSAALVVVGVLMVNAEHAASGWLSVPAWNVLMTLAVLLVWAPPHEGRAAGRRNALRLAGVLLLVFVVLAYRGKDMSGWLQLRPSWWGILGIIGWGYLGVAGLYLAVGNRPAILTGLLSLYGCVALADGADVFGWPTIPGPLVGGIVGTHGAVVLAGCLLGVLLQREPREGRWAWRFAPRALGCAAAFLAAGLLLHTLAPLHTAFTISKIHATLPWGLISAALACGAWVVLLLAVEGFGSRRVLRAVEIAGENPLLAYLLAPLLLSLFELAAGAIGQNPYAALAQPTALGLVRAAVFAWLVVRLAGWLRARGLRFQL